MSSCDVNANVGGCCTEGVVLGEPEAISIEVGNVFDAITAVAEGISRTLTVRLPKSKKLWKQRLKLAASQAKDLARLVKVVRKMAAASDFSGEVDFEQLTNGGQPSSDLEPSGEPGNGQTNDRASRDARD